MYFSARWSLTEQRKTLFFHVVQFLTLLLPNFSAVFEGMKTVILAFLKIRVFWDVTPYRLVNTWIYV